MGRPARDNPQDDRPYRATAVACPGSVIVTLAVSPQFVAENTAGEVKREIGHLAYESLRDVLP